MTLLKLKKKKIWILWKFEKNKQGEITKVPYSYKGFRTGTTSNHKDEWCDFDTAMKCKDEIGADGIGFIIPKGIVFVDIDDRALDDELSKEIRNNLNTYVETSPSGSGLHIYGLCDYEKIPKKLIDGKYKLDPKYYVKNPHNKVEVYVGGLTDRFATFTSNAIDSEDINECTDALLEILDIYMLKEKFSVSNEEVNNVVQNLLKQKNSKKFEKLYVRGDKSDYGNDDSVADLALCSMIAFRTGDNPILLDKIFKKSALYRDKWDREDYKNATIRKAIDGLNGNYHISVKDHPKFVIFKGKEQEPVISEILLANYLREEYKILLVKNAIYEMVNIYVYEHGVYNLYDDSMFKGLVKETVCQYNELLYKSKIADEVYKDLMNDRHYIDSDLLNSDETIINFKDCLVKIKEDDKGKHYFETMLHTPDIYTTIQLPCNYFDENVDTKYFDIYLNKLCENDEERKQILIEFIGVVISNINGPDLKTSLFIVADGNAGKSQYLQIIHHLLGKNNYAVMSFKNMEERFGTASILNKRFISNGDASYVSVKELNIFKMITGGDDIRYEVKGKMASTLKFTGLVCMLMNKLIKFGGDRGKHLYDRIITVPCCAEIPKNERIKGLSKLMIKEQAGIVKKALNALLTVLDNNKEFSKSKAAEELKQDYIKSNSQYVEFWETFMVRTNGDNDRCETTSKIYEIFKRWCNDFTYYVGNFNDFKDEIRDYLKIKGLWASEKDFIVHMRFGNVFNGWMLSEEAKMKFSSFSLN